MKKRMIILIVVLLFLIALVTSVAIYIGKVPKTTTDAKVPKTTSDAKGNKVTKINTTWGKYLNLYMKENSEIKFYNPRPDISKDLKVRVVKTEYKNGLESKAGFYKYAIIFEVYDAETDELLTTAGDYRNKK